jgi:hypothetical protein
MGNKTAKGEIMRRMILGICVILLAAIMVSPLWAQRATGGGESAGRGADTGAVTSSSTVSTAPSSSSSSSYSGYSAGEMGNRAYYSSTPSTAVSAPRLEGSSFTTVHEYNYWNDYYSYLYSMYRIYPSYFTRFTRNYEPRITPAMLKIALRDPLIISREMLRAIDRLESMLAEVHAGKAIDKNDIIAKSQEIRVFAKEIRENRTLSIIDVSSKKMDSSEPDTRDALGPEAIAKLREMALDLNRQLTNLYSLPSASTVSVESFKEPSFGSTAKAIEKYCRAIENSSKRL